MSSPDNEWLSPEERGRLDKALLFLTEAEEHLQELYYRTSTDYRGNAVLSVSYGMVGGVAHLLRSLQAGGSDV